MRGVGAVDVEPIRAAYDKLTSFLPSLRDDVRILVTQCPFPSAPDFELYPAVRDALLSRSDVTRVIKPGNNVLDAPGAAQWFETAIADGVQTVVVVGCTLTSCVRVSSTCVHRKHCKPRGLRTCVDLNLSGARASNYVRRCEHCLRSYLGMAEGMLDGCVCREVDRGGAGEMKSPVDRAIVDMMSAGVDVFDSFDWSSFVHTVP